MRDIPKRTGAILFGIELLLVGLAVLYGLTVAENHRGVSLVVYIGFVLLFCLLVFLLWYVFIVRQPLWWGTRATPRRLLAILISALCLAFLLEWGTLVGAPLSSPLVLSDWHVSRIAAFFFLSIPTLACVIMYRWRAAFQGLKAAACDNGGQGLRRFLFWASMSLGVALVTCLMTFGICLLVGQDNLFPYLLSAGVTAGAIVILIGLHRSLAEKPERGYLVIVLAAGVLLSTFIPLYTSISWDDHIHYDRTVATSYLLDPEYTAADRELIHREFADVKQYAREPREKQYIDPFDDNRLEELYSKIDALPESQDAIRMSGATTLRGVSIIEYYTVAYIPAAIGLWLGRLFALSTVSAFLLGRLMNVLCYALITYQAMKRLRSGKLLLAVCALVPTSVFLAAGYSYDFWLTSFLMLGFACFVGEFQRADEPLSWPRFLVMIAAFLLGLGPKAIYVPIAAMLLFMPRTKFAGSLTHRRYMIIVFASAFFVLATFVAPFFIAGPGEGDARGGAVDPAVQIATITGQPLTYIEIFFSFLLKYLSPLRVNVVLTDFCCLGHTYLGPAMLALLVGVALTDRRPCDSGYATHAKRLTMLALVFITLFLIATALFISFTPAGADFIAGVQPRYLLPFLFPFGIICLNFKPLARIMTAWRSFGAESSRAAGAGVEGSDAAGVGVASSGTERESTGSKAADSGAALRSRATRSVLVRSGLASLSRETIYTYVVFALGFIILLGSIWGILICRF